MNVMSGDHVATFEVPDWLDPRGHYVYVAWAIDDAEEAAYVGVTSRLVMRLAQHSERSPWWCEADHIDVFSYPTRIDAEKAERSAILRLEPRWNIRVPAGEVAR